MIPVVVTASLLPLLLCHVCEGPGKAWVPLPERARALMWTFPGSPSPLGSSQEPRTQDALSESSALPGSVIPGTNWRRRGRELTTCLGPGLPPPAAPGHPLPLPRCFCRFLPL